MTVRILQCVCGYRGDCQSPAPANGTPPDALPTPGYSLALCIKCARVYRLSEANAWEAFDVETLDAEQRAEVRRVQRAIHRMRRTPS